MKASGFKNPVSIIWIPEADRPIRRTRLSRAWIRIAASLLATAIATATLGILLAKASDRHRIAELTVKLQQERSGRKAEQQASSQTISRLQGQIADITGRYDHLHNQLSDLEQQAQEIKKLAGIHNVHAQSDTGNGASGSAGSNGQGGIYLPPDALNRAEAVQSLKTDMSRTDQEMGQFSQTLHALGDALAARRYLEAHTPSIWPIGSRLVTSGYGYRRDPLNGRVSFHDGVDINAYMGEPVVATAAGTVQTAGYDPQRGNYVILNHGGGLETEYMHMSRILARTGQHVDKGGEIGLAGTTGRSTGPHVHYTVLKSGRTVDPMNYLPH